MRGRIRLTAPAPIDDSDIVAELATPAESLQAIVADLSIPLQTTARYGTARVTTEYVQSLILTTSPARVTAEYAQTLIATDHPARITSEHAQALILENTSVRTTAEIVQVIARIPDVVEQAVTPAPALLIARADKKKKPGWKYKKHLKLSFDFQVAWRGGALEDKTSPVEYHRIVRVDADKSSPIEYPTLPLFYYGMPQEWKAFNRDVNRSVIGWTGFVPSYAQMPVEWTEFSSPVNRSLIGWTAQLPGASPSPVNWSQDESWESSLNIEWIEEAPVSANRRSLAEWRAELLKDGAAPAGWGAGNYQDHATALEWRGVIGRGYLSPVDWAALHLIDVDRPSPITWRSGVVTGLIGADNQTHIEWTTPVTADALAPLEWSAEFSADYGSLAEWLQSPQADALTNIEWDTIFFTANADRKSPVEWLSGLAGDNTIPILWSAEFNSGSTTPVEWAAQLHKDYIKPVEWSAVLAVVTSDNPTPLAWDATVINYGTIPTGWLTVYPDTDHQIPAEWYSEYIADHRIPAEWHGELSGSVKVPVSYQQSPYRDHHTPVEWTVNPSAVSSTATLLIGWYAVSDIDGSLPVAWKAPLATDDVIPVDHTLALIPGSYTTPAEWVGWRVVDDPAPVSWGGSLPVDLNAPVSYRQAAFVDHAQPFEWSVNASAVSSTATLLVSWSGVPETDAGSPVAWNAPLAVDGVIPVEHALAVVPGSHILPVESLGGIVLGLETPITWAGVLETEQGTPVEWTAIQTGTALITPVSWMLEYLIQYDAATPIEYLSGIAADGSLPVTWGNAFAAGHITPVEWLDPLWGVYQPTEPVWWAEWRGLVYRAADNKAEWKSADSVPVWESRPSVPLWEAEPSITQWTADDVAVVAYDDISPDVWEAEQAQSEWSVLQCGSRWVAGYTGVEWESRNNETTWVTGDG